MTPEVLNAYYEFNISFYSGPHDTRITKLCITKLILGITNYFLYPSNSEIYEKEPRYNETSL